MIAAALLLLQVIPEVSPMERVAVDRFVAACVDGQLAAANLREVQVDDVPVEVRREFRARPAGRYYRFEERPPSFLIIVSQARPDAEEQMVCALATPAANAWNLFGGVMNVLQPGRVQRRVSDDNDPLSTGMTSEEGDYSIHAIRAGPYTLIQTIQKTPKGL